MCVIPDSQRTKSMSDDSQDFSWRDTDAVVVRQQDAIAVYSNPDGDLLIRRRQAGTRTKMFGSLWRRRKFGGSLMRWKRS